MKFPFFTCSKKEEAWFFPAVLTAGVVIGFSSIALVSQFLPGNQAIKAQQAQVQANVPGASEQETASEVPANDSNELRVITNRRADLQVTWHKEQFLSDEEVIAFFQMPIVQATTTDETYHEVTFTRIWKAGIVQGGVYDGLDVYVMQYEMGGMGSTTNYQHLIKESDGSIYAIHDAPAYGVDLWYELVRQPIGRLITSLPYVEIPALSIPSTLVLNGKILTQMNHEDYFWAGDYRFNMDETKLKKVGVADNRYDVYTYPDTTCLYTFSDDGSVNKYTSRIPFKKSESGADLSLKPDIAWAVPDADKGEYEYRSVSGCGAMGCANIVSFDADESDSLIEAGKAVDGSPVYIFKNPESQPIIQKQYDNWYQPSFAEKSKPSVEEFLKTVVVSSFFWKDAIGRWVQYTSMDAVGMVECGKPVIYLYPPTTTDVTVKLPKFINVTVSDPTYPINGWHVIASSSGMLISKDDGKIYDSLYWEGTGVNYKIPKTGFVIKGSDAASFLQATLPKYGLNAKETFDFMEFWVPKLQAVPYARISFLTADWSKAAPLFVSPRPQTSIRIFMDWKPLSTPVSITAPTIITPKRNGFTLVEWGGTLYK